MPFDGVGFASDDRVSKLDQVISLLATPDKWCKAQFKTLDGRYCIRGAIMAVEGAEILRPIVLQAIRDVTGIRYLRIESFNDYPYTHPRSGTASPSTRSSTCAERVDRRRSTGRGTRWLVSAVAGFAQ
jgi:hypothetical protein